MAFLNRFFLFFVIGLFVFCAGLWISGGKEEKYSSLIEIDASPSQVFPYLTEPELLTQWVTGLEQIDRVMPPPESPASAPQLGRIVIDEKGNKNHFTDTVIRYSQDSTISIRSSKGGLVHTMVYQLEPADRGRTRFDNYVIVSYSGLNRLIAPFSSNNLENQIVAETKRLKELVESREEFVELDEDADGELETEESNETDILDSTPSFLKFDDSEESEDSSADENPGYRVPGFGHYPSIASFWSLQFV